MAIHSFIESVFLRVLKKASRRNIPMGPVTCKSQEKKNFKIAIVETVVPVWVKQNYTFQTGVLCVLVGTQIPKRGRQSLGSGLRDASETGTFF